jgi:hypothetical protein
MNEHIEPESATWEELKANADAAAEAARAAETAAESAAEHAANAAAACATEDAAARWVKRYQELADE